MFTIKNIKLAIHLPTFISDYFFHSLITALAFYYISSGQFYSPKIGETRRLYILVGLNGFGVI